MYEVRNVDAKDDVEERGMKGWKKCRSEERGRDEVEREVMGRAGHT
jgi:hypothetical protein